MNILKTSTIVLGLALGATVLIAAHHSGSEPEATETDNLLTSAAMAQQQGSFVRTAAPASFETDFTVAAEKTVNE
ncbi:MAG: hypothetical protein K2L35_06115, partial [Muribaculaceae bacterium]|nr:hypothetical protein [Muribaculaceae bacterium]